MAAPKLRVAVLIISDTAFENPSSDRVGETLVTSLKSPASSTWEHPIIKIVPDQVLDIQRTVCDWADGHDTFNLIITSGGTGFAVKDNTPEVG